MKRCSWALHHDLDQHYHDTEWGKAVHDDQLLFEMLILEGMQAGLSWHIILKRRDGMRKVLDGFDYDKIAQYSDSQLELLMQEEAIIKHRLKIESLRTNAQAFQLVQQEFGSFDAYIWSFTHGTVINNDIPDESYRQTSTALSDQISKDLKKRGFKFVGSTIVYAYLQAIGVVNDHWNECVFKEGGV
ncbi:DNA-3-methyladenine glycosylase I [Carnobacteriaceae bacterium zg-C25]|nr:DNA-3-methyladenine glycosylase I [Carnobacteriaceae bacterium zg-C25]